MEVADSSRRISRMPTAAPASCTRGHPHYPQATLRKAFMQTDSDSKPMQVRVYWRADVIHADDDYHHDEGLWAAATPQARREAHAICEVQNAVYGTGTHWVEEREAPAGG